MNKNFFIAWAVAFVVWMAGSFVVHGLLLEDSYLALQHLYRTQEESGQYFHWMLLAHVVMAGAFVWIYQRGQEDKPWAAQGVRFGIAVSLLFVIPTYTIYYVVQPLPAILPVKQSIFETVVVVIVGIAVAFMSRQRSSSSG